MIKSIRVLTIIGARPQIIKAAALSRAFEASGQIEEVIVHTGQHYDDNMSSIFFDEMKITQPKYQLDINGGDHGQMTGRMMIELEELLKVEQPNYILVYGDTNTTLAGAIVAKKKHIRLIHVEAGLRSYNMRMPEEVNRILTDRISDLLLCPTQTAVDNLKSEGYDNIDTKVILSGDVMQDASLMFSDISSEFATVKEEIGHDPFALCTIHRAENTDDITRLTSIVEALNEINTTLKVVCPLHPRTKKVLENNGLNVEFTTIEPVGYLDMIELIKTSDLVLTDSGGLQKEAYFFKRPCITMRDETEWVELIELGVNTLVGADKLLIIDTYQVYKTKSFDFEKELYGGGKASKLITDHIIADYQS
jgi:UDP-GlcNAc3NAcA epimerase